VPDRTLRNWLFSLVQEGNLERTGIKKGVRYRLIGSLPGAGSELSVTDSMATTATANTRESTEVFSAAALDILRRVDQPLYTRPPVTYSDEWVASYIPNLTFYLTEAQRNQMRQRGSTP
jgi:hypothetical protein